MAWLIGQVDAQERAELERRGWQLENVPLASLCKFLGPDDPIPATIAAGEAPGEFEYVRVFVDTDLAVIMSGPDWETGNDDTDGEDSPDSGSACHGAISRRPR